MNAQRINTNCNGIICSQVEHKWQGGSGGIVGSRKGKRGGCEGGKGKEAI